MEKTQYDQIKSLIINKLNAPLTVEEQKELDDLTAQDKSLASFLKKIDKQEYIVEQYKLYKQFSAHDDWKAVYRHINNDEKVKRLVVRITRVAAIFLIPLALATIFFLHYQNFKQNTYLAKDEILIEPGKLGAVLVLSSGEEVQLDHVRDTMLTEAGSDIMISEANGLAYQSETKALVNSEVDSLIMRWNTLKVERGREFFLTLSDGTKVWLNSETELELPVSFIGDTREVHLKGEAYFEVAKNEKMPFIVRTENMNIRVIGTSFNVMAYENESESRTTLLEGQVIINNGKGLEVILSPNQQAIINAKGINVKEIDASLVAEWKNNLFCFEYENLSTVVNKMSRWYNVEFVYADESIKSNHFSGKLPKYDSISHALELLELTTNIRFIQVDNKIVIEKEN